MGASRKVPPTPGGLGLRGLSAKIPRSLNLRPCRQFAPNSRTPQNRCLGPRSNFGSLTVLSLEFNLAITVRPISAR